MRKIARFTVIAILCLAIAISAVVIVLNRLTAGDSVAIPRCTASANGSASQLSPTQADNAALIGIRPLARGMPARAGTIGLATAFQESKLRNITYGDRDSLGLFQQRPSQGWGTAEQVMDPVYATDAFYDVLARIDGYTTMPVTEAAQKVQRSAFPDAYANHEAMGRAWASALNGHSGANITCRLSPVSDDTVAAGNREMLETRLVRDLPAADIDATSERVLAVDAAATAVALDLTADDAEQVGWAIANWAVATAAETNVETVQFAGQRFSRTSRKWADVGDEASDVDSSRQTVTITVAGR